MIKRGDFVKLKTGGDDMQVADVTNDIAACIWEDSQGNQSMDVFSVDDLMSVDDYIVPKKRKSLF